MRCRGTSFSWRLIKFHFWCERAFTVAKNITLGFLLLENKQESPAQVTKSKSKASCTCQSLLLDRMLNITEIVLQDMRGKAENEETKTSLTDVMTEVKMLRHKYSEEQKVWRELQDIHSIEVKNGTIQKGVLNSFLILYDLAF
uniref:Uncharacterized protein n=1 Tax=Sinocyclocheilus rhinocerous TaxID=307959 RepID=A0A673LAQ3_9TELE